MLCYLLPSSDSAGVPLGKLQLPAVQVPSHSENWVCVCMKELFKTRKALFQKAGRFSQKIALKKSLPKSTQHYRDWVHCVEFEAKSNWTGSSWGSPDVNVAVPTHVTIKVFVKSGLFNRKPNSCSDNCLLSFSYFFPLLAVLTSYVNLVNGTQRKEKKSLKKEESKPKTSILKWYKTADLVLPNPCFIADEQFVLNSVFFSFFQNVLLLLRCVRSRKFL